MSLLSLSRPAPTRPAPDTNREALGQLGGTTLAQRYRRVAGPASATLAPAPTRAPTTAPRTP